MQTVTITFQLRDIQLLSLLLKRASEEFSNHGCNDLPNGFFDEWTELERESLSLRYHRYNEKKEFPLDYEPGYVHMPGDDGYMSYFSSLFDSIFNEKKNEILQCQG